MVSEIYIFSCTQLRRITRNPQTDVIINDLFSIETVCNRRISTNALTFISFFLNKDKACREKRSKFLGFGARSVEIYDRLISVIRDGALKQEPEVFVTFKTGSGSYGDTFTLSYIEQISNITPFISSKILSKLQFDYNRKTNISFKDVASYIFENPITDLKQSTDFKILINYYYSLDWGRRGTTRISIRDSNGKIIQKPIHYNDIIRLYNIICVRYCTKNGINIWINDIYGIQGETNENILNNYDLYMNAIDTFLKSPQSRVFIGGKKKKSLSDCTVQELRSKMKKRKLTCSKDGKKLTKSQMIQKLRK